MKNFVYSQNKTLARSGIHPLRCDFRG